MTFLASAPTSTLWRVSLLKKYFVLACLLLACLGIQPAMAAGECSLSPVSAQTQYGQGGDTLVFSFSLSDNGGCSEESGAVKIISDSTESASLNQTTWNGSVGKTSTVSVKLGGNIGGEVVFVVQCKNCAAPNSLTFTGIVVGDYLFTAKPLSSINSTVPADTVLPLNVSLTKTGTPVPDVEVIWSQFSGPSIASVTPITGDKTDSNGENTIEFKASVPGIYVLRAIICDPAGGNRCSQLIVNFTIDVGGTPGGLQFNRISPPSPITAAPGDKISLTAEYLFKNSGYIGQKVNWDITPVSGASLQTSSTIVTDSSGKVSNQVVVDTPGSYTVTAKADCEGTEPGCPQPDIVWVINVGSSKLEIIGGDNQSGPINTLSGGLDVQATTGGSPTVGLNLIWSVLAGDATINSTTGLTDSSGKASADVLYGNTASNIVVQAARGDDPSIRVRFNLASGIPQLDNLTGNVNMVAGQSVALSGFANISGVAQGFGRINWTNNNAGTSSITSTSTPVDSGGRASVNFTPNQGGSFSVTACYSAIGSATCVGGDPVTTFTINAVALKKTSGDGQTLTVGTPSAPLSIKFEIGTPPNPQNIQWSVTGPATLSSFATTTTAAGDTSITVTPTGTGVITVRAGWLSVLPGVGNQQVNFSLSAAAPALTPVSANPIVAVVGTPFNAVVQLLDGLGAPMVGANIKFTSNTGVNSTPTTIATNASGQADSGAIFTAQVAALLNNVVKAEYDPTPLSPSSGDEVEFKFSVNASAAITRTITVAPASIEVYSGSSSYPIVFTTLDNGVPTGGITVNFNSAGDATVAPASCVTNASGTCSVNVDPSGVAFPGSSTVTGTRADDASAFAIHTVSVAQPSIVSIAGNGANGDAGTLVTLSAEVHDGFVGNAAIVGGTVSWAIIADTAGSSLSTTSSNTDGSGIASTSLTLGTLSGTVIVRATYDYGSGTVTTDFSVSINTVRTLLLHDGDGQTTPAGLAFPVNVVVEALNDGVSAPDGTQIQYSIDASSTATGTLLSCCGTTSGGFSGVGVTAGSTQGNLVIRAQRVDNPAAFILFNLTVAPPILQSIAVTPATPTIAHNGAQTFVATGTYSDASTADISASVVWTSSNTSLATMTGATANGAGSFTGGATTITATLGAISGTATLNVTAAPVALVSIAVTPATSTIASNGVQTFVATGTYNDASTADISASVVWTSSNTSLATMTGATANGAGSFTGGATTITATLGAISGTATLNVTAASVVLVSIAVTPATPTIAFNGSQTFVATGTYNDASTADISASVVWTSSNTSLATMTGATANGAGSFTGGTTTITATLGAINGTASLNVTAAPVVLVSIAVTPATPTIAFNGSQTFVATGTYNDASTADISASVIWTSSNTSLATMTGATANGAGSFTGGATTITATQGAITGTATLNVTAAPVVLVSIAVTPGTSTIASNGAQTFVATGTYNDASTADISASVIWTSSNTSLATMTGATANGAGSFTGGTSTITATQGAVFGTATLNVTAAPVVLVSIAVTPGTSTIASNGAQTFVATGTYNDASTADISASVVWTSSNTSLATMTGATANGVGSFTGGATTITATLGAISGTATLNVTAASVVLVSIAVTPATSTIAFNGSQTFVATGTYNDASTADISASVIWTSSNTSLATMTGATANGAGSFTGGATTITATLGAINGTATLNVTAAPVVLVSIAVTPATSTIASNGTQTFVATGTYNDASTADISASVVWTSSNTSLATMTGATANGAGSFTGGATTITATQGAISGTATLNVTAAPVVLVSIAVTPATPTIAFNGSQTFVATGTYNDASTADISASVIWTSSNTSLATMTGATANGAGSFTGGATTITATQGVITGTATLNVTAQPAVKTISISAGDGQSIIAGNAFSTMSVSAQDNGIPVSGLNISWTVSGTGSATPAITSSATDTSGIATITMTSVNPGAITVTAARSDDLTKFVNFNHVINPVPASTLSKQSGDAQQGVLGSLINNPLIVRLLDGFGAPISGQTITWSVLSGPATLSATSSTSDVNGDAQILLTFGNSAGTATIRASALAGSLTQDFTASAVNVTLGSASGNGQSGPVSTTLPIPLTVQITPPAGVTSLGPKYGSTKALSGVPITFAITTGSGASLSVTNVLTNAGGSASTTLTLGPTAGLYVVTASTPGGSTASFSATATTLAAGSISKLSGDSQSLTPGNASVLMRVRLLDAVNNPIAGAVIQWTAVNGTLTAATSTTDAAGEATNIVAANSSGAVSVSASYTDPATSVVTGPVTFNHNAGIGNLSGLSGEQQEIANTIDTLCPALAAIASPTPSQTALLNDCTAIIDSAAIDPAATANALDQLLPDAALAQATASMLAAQSQFQNLKARIAALRSGTQGTSFEGLAFTNSSGTISLGALGNALSGDDGASKEVGTDFQRWGFFAAGTIGRGEAEAGNINPAFDYDINGLTAGLDYRYSDKFIFGGAVGITRQGTDLAGSEGSLDTTGWSVSAYSTFYKENSWYADSVLTYGRNNYDLERRIRYTLPIPGGGFTTIDQTGRSSSSGDMLEAAFTFGHDFQKGGLSIGPYARLLYTKLGFDESVEQLESGPGSGLGIVIETRDLTSIASQVGAKFTYSYSADWGVIIPHLQVEWEHEFKDDPAQITARFLNDPTATPMVITGDPQDTDYFRIGIGLSMILNKGRSGFIYYEQMLGRDGYNQYNLGLGLRVEF